MELQRLCKLCALSSIMSTCLFLADSMWMLCRLYFKSIYRKACKMLVAKNARIQHVFVGSSISIPLWRWLGGYITSRVSQNISMWSYENKVSSLSNPNIIFYVVVSWLVFSLEIFMHSLWWPLSQDYPLSLDCSCCCVNHKIDFVLTRHHLSSTTTSTSRIEGMFWAVLLLQNMHRN